MKGKESMKKLLYLFVILFTLTSCNYQVVDYNFAYDKVHIYQINKCYDITAWRDYEDGEQIQVKLKDGSTLLLSSFNCMLIKGECPICGG